MTMPTVGVVIEPAPGDDQHYKVSLHRDTGAGPEEAAAVLVARPLPMPAGEAGDLAAALRDALRQEPADPERLRALGKHLWELVFAGAVGTAWAALAAPFRTVLDVRAPDLERLPWEVLQRGLKIAFTMEDCPFVRARLGAKEQAVVDPPLRVLVVVGQPADAALRWGDEVLALEVLGARRPDRLHVEVLGAPDLDVLADRCRQLRPHVLHLVAHGRVVNGTPSVVVEGPRGTWLLGPDQAVNLLPSGIPVAVLNACHTGDAQAVDGAVGLGDAFRENGAVATVCMQGAVTGSAAAVFSEAFYDAVVAGRSLDAACVAGRLAMALRHEGTADRWLPSLSLAMAPGPLLAEPGAPRPPVPLGAVDRAPERRRLLFAVEPPDLLATRARAAIVRGDPGVGKTWVAQAVGHVFRARGGLVRYVDLRATAKRTWLEVLRDIRGRAPGDGAPFDQLPAEAFSEFNEAVNAAAEGRAAPTTPSPGPVADLDLPVGAVSERTLDHIAALFGLFRTALVRAAGGRRLLVVLDHFSGVGTDSSAYGVNDDDLRAHLLPRLLLPVAADEVPGVRLVLVVSATPDPLREQGLVTLAEDVPVEAPATAEFAHLASVYGHVGVALGMLNDAQRHQYDAYVAATQLGNPTWSFQKLKGLAGLAAG